MGAKWKACNDASAAKAPPAGLIILAGISKIGDGLAMSG